MHNWEQFVRTHLSLPGLARQREARIVRELSSHFNVYGRLEPGAGREQAQAHLQPLYLTELDRAGRRGDGRPAAVG